MEQSFRVDPWVQIERNHGYSPEFLERAKRSRQRAAAEEMRKQGMMKYRRRGMPSWACDIIRDVSDRRGICVDQMASDSRVAVVSRARNEAMYLIKAAKPTVSSPQMGKWFNRDHTSILYGISSHQERYGLPILAGYDVALARIRKREWAAYKRSKASSKGTEQ